MMAELKVLINQLEEAALHPAQTIGKTCKDTGKDAIGCFPIYTPEELVYAAGFIPVGMWGGPTELKLVDKYLQSFCCSIMRTNIEFGMKGTYDKLKAVIIPTFCDTLKCIVENWKVAVPQVPVLPIVYPQHRRIAAGEKYLVEELTRVLGEIEKVKGSKVSEADLENSLAVYEDYRSTMREFVEVAANCPVTINAKTRHLLIKAAYFMDKKEYTAIMKEIITGLKAIGKEDFKGIRAIATGLMAEPVGVLDVFVENNIAIVGDDLAQESRQFRTLTRKEGSPIERIAFRTTDQRGCTFLYEEEKTRGQMLIDMAKEKDAQMVVTVMMKFCDPEEFDYPIYKAELEAAKIPLLYLEVEQQMDSLEQVRTRVQSFAEMLS